MENAESKKEEFQRYLEKSGVIDALTKVFVGLYEVPDKPENAIDYIREYLGFAVGADQEEMQKRLEEQARLLSDKDKEIEELRKQVSNQYISLCLFLSFVSSD